MARECQPSTVADLVKQELAIRERDLRDRTVLVIDDTTEAYWKGYCSALQWVLVHISEKRAV